MSASLALLDEALRIGTQELDALRNGEVELAESLYAERVALTSQAWENENSKSIDALALIERSRALLSQQKELLEEGRSLKMYIQAQLNQSRQQTQRMKGYGTAIKQALVI